MDPIVARMVLVLSDLALWAQAHLDAETSDRQYLAEHMVDSIQNLVLDIQLDPAH